MPKFPEADSDRKRRTVRVHATCPEALETPRAGLQAALESRQRGTMGIGSGVSRGRYRRALCDCALGAALVLGRLAQLVRASY